MFDETLVKEILIQIDGAIAKITRRFEPINSSDDFLYTEAGQGVLDSICMQLIAFGESLKNIDKVTNHEFLNKYQNIEWKKAKGLRDIITHHYFDLDAETIFDVCKNEIPNIHVVVKKMIEDLNSNS
jgi:uncharacterized protein with HEPN domain